MRNLADKAERHAASRVEITLSEDGPAARLTIADDGPGIPPEQHEEVFERFARLDGARTEGGSGLGLALARHIVLRHGGSITIDALYASGTRFVVELPSSEESGTGLRSPG